MLPLRDWRWSARFSPHAIESLTQTPSLSLLSGAGTRPRVDWPPQTVDAAEPALTHPEHAGQCACQSPAASGAAGGLRLTFSAARDDDLLFGGPARGFAGVDLRGRAREV